MNFFGARLHYLTISSKISIAKIIIMSKLIARDHSIFARFKKKSVLYICMIFFGPVMYM